MTCEVPFERQVQSLANQAASLRIEFCSLAPRKKRSTLQGTRKTVFAAFEACRQDPHKSISRRDLIFYRAFLGCTLLSPLIVLCFFPFKAWSVGWDFVGIASTIILIGYTYGVYTIRMSANFIKEVSSVIISIMAPDVKQPFPPVPSEDETSDMSGAVAFANLLLLAIGTALSLVALTFTFDLNEMIRNNAPDIASCNVVYLKFFLCIFFLSFIFIIMDVCVARYEKSHSESFIASSSIVHATVPMFIGICIMAFYLFSDFFYARYVLGLDAETVLRKLPVDFVSGALSFQMIISNTLFIFIKMNMVFRAVYTTIDSTSSD